MLKATGITRKVDELGRFVLPVEIRKIFELKTNDEVQLFLFDNYIAIRKNTIGCLFCNQNLDLINYENIPVCKHCIDILYRNYLP